MNLTTFIPFWQDAIVVILLFITAIFFAILVDKVSKSNLKKSSYILLTCGFISFTVINNYFIYQPTNLTVSLSNLFMIIAILIIYNNFLLKRNLKYNILIGLLLSFPISMYESCCQTFVVLVFITSFIHCKFNNEDFKRVFKFVFISAVTLLVGIVLNQIISDFVIWILKINGKLVNDFSNKITVVEVIKNGYPIRRLFRNKLVDLFANNSLFIREFLILGLLGFVLSIFNFVKKKDEKGFYLYLFAFLSNFILLAIMAKNLYRICYSWSIFVGFVLFYINESFNGRKSRKAILIILGFIIFMQTQYMNTLFYNDYVGYRRDILYVSNIINNLQNTCKDLSKPLLFVEDERDLKFKDLEINSDNRFDYIGWGLNSFDGDGSELVKLFNYLGYEFDVVDDVEKAREIYYELDNETKSSQIIELDEFIVVKVKSGA